MTDKLINAAITIVVLGFCALVWAVIILGATSTRAAEPAPSPDRMCVGEYPDGSTDWVPCEWLKTRDA